MNLIRPADAEEVIGAWLLALSPQEAQTPTLLALARQELPVLKGTDRSKISLGAYTVREAEDGKPALVLVASGAEVSLAVKVAHQLAIPTRVVSMPSMRHFDGQPLAYRRQLLPVDCLKVGIEAWSSIGWAKYVHAGCHLNSFGMSAPPEFLFEYFGFGVDNLVSKITAWVGERKKLVFPQVGEFEELLFDYGSEHKK